jgi:hypothetical protein
MDIRRKKIKVDYNKRKNQKDETQSGIQSRNKTEEVLHPIAPPVPQEGDRTVKTEIDDTPSLNLFN